MVVHTCNRRYLKAEAGESLDSEGGERSEPRSYHCTLAWATERDYVSKKKG